MSGTETETLPPRLRAARRAVIDARLGLPSRGPRLPCPSGRKSQAGLGCGPMTGELSRSRFQGLGLQNVPGLCSANPRSRPKRRSKPRSTGPCAAVRHRGLQGACHAHAGSAKGHNHPGFVRWLVARGGTPTVLAVHRLAGPCQQTPERAPRPPWSAETRWEPSAAGGLIQPCLCACVCACVHGCVCQLRQDVPSGLLGTAGLVCVLETART